MTANYFKILKTTKNINEIIEKIEDRMIITKSGEMYFDYSSTERIRINTSTAQYVHYLTTIPLLKRNEKIIINYENIKTLDEIEISDVDVNSFIFDNLGNFGIITQKNSAIKKCQVLIISNLSESYNKDEIDGMLAVDRVIE